MFSALIRKAFANLRSRKLQTVALFIILTLATTLLTLAVAVQVAAANPWERTFEQTQGAHIWFSAQDEEALAYTAGIENVTATTEPYRIVINTPDVQTAITGFRTPLLLMGRPADIEHQIARVLMLNGRWLAAGAANEVVLDSVLAEVIGMTVGDSLTLTRSGQELTATIVGIVYNPAPIPCPRYSGEGLCTFFPGHTIYMLPETLSQLAPDDQNGLWVQGVRLADPDAAEYVKTAVQNSLPAGVDLGSATWLQIRDRQVEEIRFNQILLKAFSVFALGLAGFILINVVSGQILGEYREIALLKSIGFRPQEVSLLYLITQILLGLLAAVVGILLALPLTGSVIGDVAEVLNATGEELITPPLLIGVAGAIVLLVALFTLFPAWQAGQANTVQAISVGYAPPSGRPSLMARLAAALRLPPTVVLGVKDAFARPLRALLTIIVIAVGVTAVTFSLSVEATIQNAIDDPSLFGYFPVDLMARVESLPFDDGTENSSEALNEKTRAFLETNSAVASFISYGTVRAVGDGTEDAYLVQAVGDDLGLVFSAHEGRQLTTNGEAMVSQSMVDAKGMNVGDEVALLVGDRRVVLRVVGVYYGGAGDEPALLTTIETLAEAGIPVETSFYGIQAVSQDVVASLTRELQQSVSDRLAIDGIRESIADDVLDIRALVYTLNLVLLAIVGANVLATTLLTVRERFHDLATMKLVGMTPRQVARSVASGNLVLSLMAVIVGIPFGLIITRWLIQLISDQIGLSQGIARLPDLPWLALIIPVTLLVVAIGSVLPAHQASRLSIAEAFRME